MPLVFIGFNSVKAQVLWEETEEDESYIDYLGELSGNHLYRIYDGYFHSEEKFNYAVYRIYNESTQEVLKSFEPECGIILMDFVKNDTLYMVSNDYMRDSKEYQIRLWRFNSKLEEIDKKTIHSWVNLIGPQSVRAKVDKSKKYIVITQLNSIGAGRKTFETVSLVSLADQKMLFSNTYRRSWNDFDFFRYRNRNMSELLVAENGDVYLCSDNGLLYCFLREQNFNLWQLNMRPKDLSAFKLLAGSELSVLNDTTLLYTAEILDYQGYVKRPTFWAMKTIRSGLVAVQIDSRTQLLSLKEMKTVNDAQKGFKTSWYGDKERPGLKQMRPIVFRSEDGKRIYRITEEIQQELGENRWLAYNMFSDLYLSVFDLNGNLMDSQKISKRQIAMNFTQNGGSYFYREEKGMLYIGYYELPEDEKTGSNIALQSGRDNFEDEKYLEKAQLKVVTYNPELKSLENKVYGSQLFLEDYYLATSRFQSLQGEEPIKTFISKKNKFALGRLINLPFVN
ncbi:hypothetical protein [Croceimicrobium hydrocarbonivorans]|uniref:Uncharacterized protein n=1 Tax=Croceimicrobium hydrocarbonivorans TaxID=2761580 RepID=A0A7H0VCH4_9FLAO|nr:hypothetical protein [Croceimicrobium hydrocarbonivorans]QNR23422.1 hypothetical protein H4K34_13690 [Croceimicrobium hydrocarbonivorans]